MPTDEWFSKILKYVDFKGKSVIDYGCAEGRMCRLAKDAGARWVTGIDSEASFELAMDIDFELENIKDYKPEKHDMGIFSMIIHWIGKEETVRQLPALNTAIIIFREPNEGYQIPQNGKWFPTLKELDKTLSGFSRKHTEVLHTQDNNKTIRLAIYEKNN